MKYHVQIGEKSYDFEVNNHQPPIQIWQNGSPVAFDWQKIQENLYSLILAGKQYRVWITPKKNGEYRIVLNQTALDVGIEDERTKIRKSFQPPSRIKVGVTQIRAPMPGLVTQIEVKPNQVVKAGEGLLIVEAMKMENEIRSPVGGRVIKIEVNQGDTIEKDTLLVEIVEQGFG